jgi:hypothetical protein
MRVRAALWVAAPRGAATVESAMLVSPVPLSVLPRGTTPASAIATGLRRIEQDVGPPFATRRSRPLCEWPNVPRFVRGDLNAAASFECRP